MDSVVKKTLLLTNILVAIAYIVPILFLLAILYLNYLPFGYTKDFSIDLGKKINTEEIFSLTSEDNLSWAITDNNGSSYRILYGPIAVTFKPDSILRQTNLAISLEGTDVAFAPSPLFNPNDIVWDNEWNFQSSIPEDLTNEGNSITKNTNPHCALFDGKTRLTLPNSFDRFDTGPFLVYLEWEPRKKEDGQQLIGHHNWEIWQQKNNINFSIGRMNNDSGNFYSISYPIDGTFFFKKHSLLAVYHPSIKGTGYIELFVDNKSSGKKYIGKESISKDYGSNNLSFGWSEHSGRNLPRYYGCLYTASYFAGISPIKNLNLTNVDIDKNGILFDIIPTGKKPRLSNIKIKAEKH